MYEVRFLRRVAALAVAIFLSSAAAALAQFFEGTNGADVINGTPQADAILGLGGDDAINAAAGNDDIDGGAGADDIRGGPAIDAVLYGGRSGSIAVALDDVANDGEAGEADNVHGDVEQVFGGQGGDRLTGNAGPNLLDGVGGDDVLFGGAGSDRIYGGTGDDVVTSFDGAADVVDCGPGNDTVTADRTDVVIGCERRIPPPRIRSAAEYSFTVRGLFTRVDRLTITRIPSAGVVEVRCRGGGCPFRTNRTRPRTGQSRIRVANLFRGRRLRAGAAIYVQITAPNTIGRVFEFHMRSARLPRIVTRCLPLGSETPSRQC